MRYFNAGKGGGRTCCWAGQSVKENYFCLCCFLLLPYMLVRDFTRPCFILRTISNNGNHTIQLQELLTKII